MTQRRILFLDDSHLIAFRAGGADVEQEAAFASNEAGFEAFAAYLARHSRSLFLLLADVAEEGFIVEDLPYSTGRDRAAIIKRKLGQHFYGTPLAIARSLGRLKTGRRDERMLLMALSQPQHFDPWLTILNAAQANLAGIYTVPQLVAHLLAADAPAQLLFISLTRSGLRQTFFSDRQLRFSRLTPLATGTVQEFALTVTAESEKMHQYLTSQRLIDRKQPLVTRLLVHPAQRSFLHEYCRDSANLHFEFSDSLAEGKRLGLRSIMSDSRAELLFSHLLVRHTPVEQFAGAPERRYYRLWQVRYALKVASAVVLTAASLTAAKLGLDIFSMHDATEKLRQQIGSDQQKYAAAFDALPKIPLSTDNLRAVVDRYDQVAARSQGPASLLIQLSQSLDMFPGITLDQIDWKTIEKIDVAPPNMATGPYAQATITARLPLGMVGDQRGQLDLVANFTKHLGASPNTLVTILTPPVDTESGKTLKSGDERSTPEAPRFSFRLVRKL